MTARTDQASGSLRWQITAQPSKIGTNANPLRVRGLERVQLHADLTILAKALLCARQGASCTARGVVATHRQWHTEPAMSNQNVRLVERAIAAINARDVEGYLACCTEDVKLETPFAAVGAVYEGIDDIRRFFADIEEAAPDFRIEFDGVEEVDSKRVIAFLRTSSTGRASGIRMASPTTNVYDLLDGKLSHIRIFFDRQEALKAVGMA